MKVYRKLTGYLTRMKLYERSQDIFWVCISYLALLTEHSTYSLIFI